MRGRPPNRKPPSRPRYELEELEPRCLYSADPLVGALLGTGVAFDPSVNGTSSTHIAALTESASAAPSANTQQHEQKTVPTREVVFIDLGIDDANAIVTDLRLQQEQGRMVEIVTIATDEDGLSVISQYLSRQTDPIGAVHILSHGDANGLQLGDVRLDQRTLDARLSEVSGWGSHLSAEADLLLYGCNLASGTEGVTLIEQLALLTGADVAASDDYTGATALDGDWVLEYQTGSVDSAIVLSSSAQGQWQQVLATASFQNGTSSYTGTSDTFINSASPNANNGAAATIAVTDASSQQILIKFDNIFGTGAGQIRYGSTITAATLTVYTTQDGTGNPAIYRIISANWTEDSTWNTLTSGISLNNSEASSTADSSVDVSGNNTTDIFTNLAGTVQLWASGGTNNGWVIVDDGNEWNFASSENATVSQRPILNVTYTAPTPPTLDLDASGAGSNFSTTFTEGGAAIKIADTDASVLAGSNTISPALSSMTVTISNLLDGTAESLAATTTGTNITASYDSGTGVLSLTGTDTAANYQTVLRSVTYNNTDDTPTTTNRSITVVAADPYGGNSTTVTSTMAITATNDAPVITSNGGAATASISLAETLTAVTTVTSTDPEGTARTYSIVAGDDGAKFSIVAGTGVLTFVSAPDYETPTDSNLDNVYVVTVRASDGSLSDTQTISVTITDVVSTLVVDTTTDNNDTGMGTSFTAEQLNATKGTDGKVSLREAIIAANTTGGTDTISFNMSGGAGTYGEFTILVGSALPYITDAVYINGASQSGYSTQPLIVLDGEGGSGYGLYLSNTADGSTIRGLLIRDFGADAIHVQLGSDNHTIVGNYLGSFNADGSNAGAGERNLSEGIESYGANLVVGGTTAADRNVISGNASAYNIYLATGANGTTIQGNYIGTDAAGTSAFTTTNSSYGIMVESPATNITIGGTANGAGNVISGFTSRGVWVTTSGTTTLQGNKVGTDVTGTLDLGNTQYGVYIDDTGSVIIGGTATNAGNLISGNNGGGIYANNTGSVTVQGNIIGLDASGTSALGNTGPGIYLSSSAVSTIGGNTAAARNIISGNSTYGIEVRSSPSGGHVIKGNYIGVGSNGSTLLGNGGAGIYIAASDVKVGGKSAGDANIIAGNGGGGIVVASGNGNLFYQNSIHSNTGLGIDLGNDGVTANDYGDADAGANYQTNFPVITSVVTNGANTTITGSIEWYAQSQPIYIEFFSNATADASGHGEGRTYLGFVQVTTDATTGDASFSVTLTGVSVGDWITAVANVEGGFLGASEFALSVQAVGPTNAPRGRVIWNNNDRFFQQYADWSSTGFGGTGVNGLSFGDDLSMILAAEAPTRNEIIFIGASDVSGKILAGIWNGSSWSSVISIPIADPGADASSQNSFAVAYDEVSGNAMLVWDNGTTGTAGLSYAIWNGTSWSATATITAPVSGEPLHMQLAASPNSQEMILVVETAAASNNQYAIVWNGSSWGNAQTLGSNSSKQYFELNVAYERQSGQAMVIYDASGSNSSSVQYRTWNGSTWSSEGTVAAPAGTTGTSELYSTVIASDAGSDRIAIGAKNALNEVWFSVWDGNAWGTGVTATTSGVALTDQHATMAVAFESQSGDLLAVYGKAAGPNIYYRTWTSGGGWSAEGTGPSMGGTDVPYVAKLYSDPYSNTIMLGVQDGASDLNMVTWDGSAWGTVTELDAATGHTYRENFTYVWYRDAPVISNLDGETLSYSEDSAATPIDQGGNASVVLGSGLNYDGGNLTVSFTSGSTSAEDVLGIRNQGSGAGQIGLSGANVTYGGTVIGTYSGGSLGSNLVITLNANATDVAVSALISNITYANANTSTPSTTDRNVRFVVTNPLGHASANCDVTVTVTAVNDAPVNSIPGAQSTNEDTPRVFSVGNGNLISISDVDAGSASVQVSLSVSNGTLSLSSITGLSFSVGDGTGDASMVFSGTISAINTALAGLTYTPTANYNGSDTLSITTSDLGNAGSGGTKTDTDLIAITVNAVNDAPVISSNGGGASASVNVAENATAVTTVVASDLEGTAITYSISGGADAGKFTINASTGALSFVSAPDFENPTDVGGNNVYDVIVQASDGGLTDTQSIAVTVTAVNDNSPVISSNGGGATASVNVAENSTAVTTVTATDGDLPAQTLNYSISGGADSALFSINSSTGVLTFTSGRNRESATDANADHVYEVTVQVSDGTNTDTQAISVTVTDVDEFDVGAISDVNATANSVAENAANGTLVRITARATDADATNNTITYTLSNNAGGRFAINSSTGVVTVANGTLLNREAAASHSITVLATSADGSTRSQAFTINLTDVDEFNVGPVTDVNAAANNVAENAGNGTAVGITASASDADATTNTITYTLSDTAGGRFAVNSSNGVVTVADGTLLNYEAATSHSITVLATSADGSSSSQSFTINLTDADEFNVGAVTDVNAAANSVTENTANGTVVGITANAVDADGTNNTVTYTLIDNAGGRFAINSSTGVVTVADGSLLNYESATSHSITVLATSADGSTSSQSFSIDLTDVDEFNVGAVTDIDATANGVAENAANGTTVGITASATDADGSTNAITYTLSDAAGGRFAINSNTGVVTVADGTLLNHESATSHSITVLATSADGSTSSQSFTINLADVDEFNVGPVMDVDASANSVAENATNGTAVGITANAVDADGTNNTITYTLSDTAGGRFAINSGTGVITVADGSLLNHESAASHSITVLATSADGSTSSQAFTINIGDVDEFDVGPVSDINVAVNNVSEIAANGTLVGITASATDPDGTTNAITYTLLDNAGGRFAIDGNSGVVTVADGSLLDFETNASHDITVQATSADGSSSTQTFTINITNGNESGVGSISDTDVSADGIQENATNGTLVGITASASDLDVLDTVTYTLSDDAGGRFAIDNITGVITVLDGSLIDRESASSHDITVLATSTDTTTSSRTFTVVVADVNEAAIGPVTDADVTANITPENAANGSLVGITANAVDADATNSTITYTLSDNAGGRFAIDSATGVVTVANGSLLNHEVTTSHSITVLATSADGSSSSQGFTINLSDVDEFNVGPVTDANASTNSVAENATNGTLVGITAFAVDADSTTDTITYALLDSAGGRFAIDSISGIVTVANGSLLNHESASSHSITVLATSADGSSSSQSFTINLTDVDEFDVSPVTDVDATPNSVAENTANGTVVGITANATDADGTTNAINYTLIDSAGGRFSINNSTGVVTVADGSLLNHESATSHTITVLATSADGSTSSQTFTINLTDIDEFNVGPISDLNGTANGVTENAANGTVVGITANAIDADGTNNTVTYSLSDSAGGRFAIDSITGIVTVADGSLLDREIAASHSITVLATGTDGSTSNQSFTIDLSDVDEFDVSAVIDINPAANSVAEHTGNGTVVGLTASAADPDATNNTITYSLSDNAGGRFAIDSSTGIVTVADGSLLDHEDANSHSITVLATSTDGSTSSQTFTIDVGDVDEFDVGPVSDINAALNSVSENASNGTVVGITTSAVDADGTNSTITYTLSDDAGGRFAIDSSTGVVTVANGTLLDHETDTSHTITVLATSADGSTSSQTFTIDVNEVDEFDVGPLSDVNAAANSVTENAASGTVVGITANAVDTDGTNNTVTYTLSDNAGGRFAIDSSTGVVTVANGSLLNYEGATSHAITVVATSTDGSSSNVTWTVNLTDVDEVNVSPVSDIDATANSVAENATNGTTVGLTANAVDADGTNNTVTYTLSDNAGGRFAINGTSGVVTVANASLLNHESATSHTVTVVATSADGSTSNQTFTINLSDVDEFDVGPITDINAAANSVVENAANGTVVGITANATDADGTNSAITYALSDNAGGRFAINSSTGVITVANSTLLNYESATSHSITVLATSADGSTSTQSFTVNLTDANEFNVSPLTDIDGAANSVVENAANGTVVGITANASDADASTNAVTYSLSNSAGGRFTIDSNTGVITVANGTLLDFESNTAHSITVIATSQDGSSSLLTLTINLVGVNDNGPSIASPAQTSVTELTTSVTRVVASDADLPTQTLTYYIAGGLDASQFLIDAVTGDLSFVTPPAFDLPADQDQNNRYEVIVGVSDGVLSQTLSMQIEVRQVAAEVVPPIGVQPPVFPDLGTDPPVQPPLVSTPGDGVDTDTPTETPTDSEPEAPSATPGASDLAPERDLTDQVRGQSPGSGAYQVENYPIASQAWSSWMTMGAPNRLAMPGQATGLISGELQPNTMATLTRTSVQINPWSSGPSVTASNFFFDATAKESGALVINPSITALGGVSLSLGLVWWATRASALVSSLLITTPAWRTLDPLPIFMANSKSPDDESTEPTEDEAERMFDEPPEHEHTMQFIH